MWVNNTSSGDSTSSGTHTSSDYTSSGTHTLSDGRTSSGTHTSSGDRTSSDETKYDINKYNNKSVLEITIAIKYYIIILNKLEEDLRILESDITDSNIHIDDIQTSMKGGTVEREIVEKDNLLIKLNLLFWKIENIQNKIEKAKNEWIESNVAYKTIKREKKRTENISDWPIHNSRDEIFSALNSDAVENTITAQLIQYGEQLTPAEKSYLAMLELQLTEILTKLSQSPKDTTLLTEKQETETEIEATQKKKQDRINTEFMHIEELVDKYSKKKLNMLNELLKVTPVVTGGEKYKKKKSKSRKKMKKRLGGKKSKRSPVGKKSKKKHRVGKKRNAGKRARTRGRSRS
jgi:hypothetical protein